MIGNPNTAELRPVELARTDAIRHTIDGCTAAAAGAAGVRTYTYRVFTTRCATEPA